MIDKIHEGVLSSQQPLSATNFLYELDRITQDICNSK